MLCCFKIVQVACQNQAISIHYPDCLLPVGVCRNFHVGYFIAHFLEVKGAACYSVLIAIACRQGDFLHLLCHGQIKAEFDSWSVVKGDFDF